jgi:hypothetical protein
MLHIVSHDEGKRRLNNTCLGCWDLVAVKLVAVELVVVELVAVGR